MGSINRKKINLRKEKKNQFKKEKSSEKIKETLVVQMFPEKEEIQISGTSRVDLQRQFDEQKNESHFDSVVIPTREVLIQNKDYGHSMVANYRGVKSEFL